MDDFQAFEYLVPDGWWINMLVATRHLYGDGEHGLAWRCQLRRGDVYSDDDLTGVNASAQSLHDAVRGAAEEARNLDAGTETE